jgi:hypothetical protein
MKILYGVLRNRHGSAKRYGQAGDCTRRLLALHQKLDARYLEAEDVDSLLLWAERERSDALVVLLAGLCVTDNAAIVRAVCEIMDRELLLCADGVVVRDGKHRRLNVGGLGFLAINVLLWQRVERLSVVLRETEERGSNKDLGFGVLPIPQSLRDCCFALCPNNAVLFRSRLRELREMGTAWCNQPWFVNTEDPAGWCGRELNGPCQTLVSVAAGLIPNVILQVAGFCDKTKIVYFDVSENALRFRDWLIKEWDGIDYRQAACQWLAENKHVRSWQKVDSQFAQALSRVVRCFGGPTGLRKHWEKYRHLKHIFIQIDALREDPSLIFEHIVPKGRRSVIWWSNIFHSLYTHTHFSSGSISTVYDKWVRVLEEAAPNIVAFGQDDLGRPVSGPL